MSDLRKREAELLIEVKRARATFQAASDHCRERHEGSVRECLEPASRGYLNALRAFSGLIFGRIALKEGSEPAQWPSV